jgi:hypothetical protein
MSAIRVLWGSDSPPTMQQVFEAIIEELKSLINGGNREEKNGDSREGGNSNNFLPFATVLSCVPIVMKSVVVVTVVAAGVCTIPVTCELIATIDTMQFLQTVALLAA